MSWTTWAAGTLRGIGAPSTTINLDSLSAWSHAESGADLMRWNNPLNTTWNLPGAVNMNSVGVKAYANEDDGIRATVLTLLQPRYYGIIVDHLRKSVPRSRWADCCAELGLWGTGCGWIDADYGAAPGALEDDMSAQAESQIATLYGKFANPGDPKYIALEQLPSQVATLKTELDAIKAQLATAPAGGGGLTDADRALLEGVDAKLTRIEAAFKAA